jgi:hypothetical protein
MHRQHGPHHSVVHRQHGLHHSVMHRWTIRGSKAECAASVGRHRHCCSLRSPLRRTAACMGERACRPSGSPRCAPKAAVRAARLRTSCSVCSPEWLAWCCVLQCVRWDPKGPALDRPFGRALRSTGPSEVGRALRSTGLPFGLRKSPALATGHPAQNSH